MFRSFSSFYIHDTVCHMNTANDMIFFHSVIWLLICFTAPFAVQKFLVSWDYICWLIVWFPLLPVCPQTPISYFGIFVKTQVNVAARTYVLCSVLYSIDLHTCFCVSAMLFLTTALHYSLNSFHSNLFVQDYLGNPWSSVSTYKFYFFPLFVKNAVGILIEIALNL